MPSDDSIFPAPLPPLHQWLREGARLPGWLSKPHMARTDSVPLPASFEAQLDNAVRQAKLSEMILKRDPFSRLARRRGWVADWLEHHGHPTPEHLAGPVPLQEIPIHLARLQAGVIKPINATNAWGVLPFRRTGAYSARNLFDGKTYSFTELLEILHTPMQRYMFPNRWQIEELLNAPDRPDHVPDDFKAYAFAGQVPLILQVRRGAKGNRYKFYDSSWTAVDTGKYHGETDNSLPPPANPQVLLDLACKISNDLPAPFCRIDLFETPRGPVVGELTPEPGGYQKFDAQTDLYLGVFYDHAQAVMNLKQP